MKKTLLFFMTLFALSVIGMKAQDAPLKIVTGHPDLKLQIKRCAASGTTVVVDMVLTNIGTTDIDEIQLFGTDWRRGEAYDDEGNIYSEDNGKTVLLKLSNYKEYEGHTREFRMLSDIPMRVSVRIEGFSTTAERIALLRIGVDCRQWGLKDKTIVIRNIPIDRD